MALTWAERLPEARDCLAERLQPSAAISALRWAAWANFVDGLLAVRAGDIAAAEQAFRLGEARFSAERLIDGQVSIHVAMLTLWRRAGDLAAYDATLVSIDKQLAGRTDGGAYYSKGHDFTSHAIVVDRAERARIHDHDLDTATDLYHQAAASPFPLIAALGKLGVGMVAHERGDGTVELTAAASRARAIGARLATNAATTALMLPGGTAAPEVFFC